MEIRVLGPIEVLQAGVPVSFARRQQRLIIGILAVEANQFVSCDRLIDLIWADQAPRQARAVVQSRISELRARIAESSGPEGSARLLTHADGYVLEIPPSQVDVHRFRQVVANWRSGGADDDARLVLRQALQLWRGPFLGGELTHETYSSMRHSLEAARLTAAEDLFDVELKLGRHFEVVAEIVELASENPMRERLTGQLMLGLHRTGRSAEALHAYDRWRRWLRDELGVNPGRQVQELHVAILNNSGEIAADSPQAEPADPPKTRAFAASVPRILPPDIVDFTGRDPAVAFIHEVMTRKGEEIPLVAISGPGGVGKTALSIRAAHGLREQFTDGQLYANLRGGDETEIAEPFSVLGRFLRALGVDGVAIPDTLDERVDLYRDLLADRKVLVVLDNAVSDHQVLPLIPGSSSCGVIVNSRARLGATISARTISLDVLGDYQAIDLLSRIAGASRVEAEPSAAADLARLCGHLPLALRVVGAKLSAKPHWSIAKFVDLLVDERGRLDHFSHGHLDVRASIAVSCASLPEVAQRLLRRLGHVDLPEITVWAAAALLDEDAAIAEQVLELLFDAQLIDAAGHDASGHTRYRLHDLVRLFALERADLEEPDELRQAVTRTLACCLHISETHYRHINGGDYQNIRGDSPRWSPGDKLVTSMVDHSLRWFDADKQIIIAIVRRAAKDQHVSLCWEIVCTTSPFFEMRQQFDELQSILDVAHSVTEQAGDDRGHAATLYRMATNCTNRGDHDRARDLLQHAADVFAHVGDLHGHATMTALGGMADRFLGNSESALDRYQRALPVLRETGDLGGAALTLRGIGQIHLDRSDLVEAEACFQEALEIYRTTNSQRGEAQVLFWLGMLRLRQKRHQDAVEVLQEALTTCRALGDRAGEAQCLRGLGIGLHQMGDSDKARETLLEALELVRQPRPTMIEGHIQRTLTELSPGA